MKRGKFKDWIIIENDDFLAINKPEGIPSLHNRDGNGLSIIELAKQYHADAQLCHRLDMETSGILLIAKNPETYRSFAMQFENRSILKTYHAVVDGLHKFDQHEVQLPIKVMTKGYAKIDTKEGKPSFTIFSGIEYFKHFSLLACFPFTGRLHQIRVHLASQNAPITSDTFYGGKVPHLSELKRKYHASEKDEEKPLFNRVALHAFSLSFEFKNQAFQIEAPYPHDLSVFLKLLRKYDSF